MYGAVSSTLLSHIDPLMRNMLELWLKLVKELGMDSPIPQIKELTRLIAEEIGKGKWIRASYKATFFRRKEYENLDKFDALLCWINDWTDCPKKVIEIRKLVTLHES